MKKLFFIIFTILFLSLISCGIVTEKEMQDIQKSETSIVGEEDEEIEENIDYQEEDRDTIQEKIYDGFYDYEVRFHPRNLLNWYVITNETQKAMKEAREDLRDVVDAAQATNSLEENNYKIDSCVGALEEYESFIALTAEFYDLEEERQNRELILGQYVDAYEYNEAHEVLAKVRETLLKIIENLKKRQEMDIEQVTNEEIQSWQAYYDAYGDYDEFIDLWYKKSYILADEKYEDISKAWGDSNYYFEKRTMARRISEVEQWYENNVGVCLEVYKKSE